MGLRLNSSCVLCGDSTLNSMSLCDPCREDLPTLKNACEQCGIPLNVSSNSVCGQCIKIPPAVDYTLSLYHYQIPMDYLITELKFNQQLPHAAILGQLLLARIIELQNSDDLPDVILPVPLHKSRLIKRGFNQSLEISRPVAKYFDIPIETRMVSRNKPTRAQTDLNASQRKKNVRGCFELQKQPEKLANKHVVIIDDVVTTGSTTNELALLLKKSGVEKVGVWSIARAVLY